MNAVFTVIFLFCSLWFLIFSPDQFLSCLLDGAGKAGTLLVSLLSVYAVWLGFSAVAEECGLNKKLARLLKKPVQKLFCVQDEKAEEYLCANLSCNMLGISGAATPFALKAVERLKDLEGAQFSLSMLLVVSATSVQILPTTVLSLMTSFGSSSPFSIILPSLLCTAFTSVTGVLFCKILVKNSGKNR